MLDKADFIGGAAVAQFEIDFAHLCYQAGAFPYAEKLSQPCLSLPLCSELTMAEAEEVIRVVKAFFESRL